MPVTKANLNGKKVLFIAYFYPPISSTGVPGAMRTIKFLRNLSNGKYHVLTRSPITNSKDSALNHITLPVNNECIHQIEGWDIFKSLLSLRDRFKREKKTDSSNNLQTSISDQSVYKSTNKENQHAISNVKRLKDFIYNLCYFPDQAGPWMLPATRYGKKLVREQNIDVIFATGSPWSGLIVGYLISKATGKPLIADFRDPWMNNPFLQSKGKLLDKWSLSLEKKIVAHASAISLNTEPLQDEFIERYPNISKEHFFVMPNGFDKADFEEIVPVPEKKGLEIMTLCHAGFLYGVRDPAVLLNAIQTANNKLAKHNKKIQFIQIGDVQLAYDIKNRYSKMIQDGSLLIEPTRPYQECLKALQNADWVVNVQPATKSQIPSKLYDYLAINRPILNITPEDGALGQLVTKHGLGKLFSFNDDERLSEALVEMAINQENIEQFEGYSARSQFDYAAIAKQLSDKITEIA